MKTNSRASSAGYRIALFILVLTNLVAIGWIAQPSLEQRGIHLPILPENNSRVGAALQSPSPTPPQKPGTPTDTPVPILLQNDRSPVENMRAQGVLVLAMRDGIFSHLFAYHPLYLPLTRLTNNAWDDESPSLSPDGKRLAFASHQNGSWDLYILDLNSGQVTRLTNTPEYEGSPTWSPDGQWLAYERYNGASLDIYLQSLADTSSAPIPLTNDPGIDRSPAWSPQGREIAFVSTRSGDEEIWLARLDDTDHRFVNVSNNPLSRDSNPVWNPDGSWLAWAANEGGDQRLMVWNPAKPDLHAKAAGTGDQAAWSPDGKILFSQVRDPNHSGLTAYLAGENQLALPYSAMPGEIYGMTWVRGVLPAWLESATLNPDTQGAPALWQPALTRNVAPHGRAALIPLNDVTAPQPMLQDAVDEAFNALRAQVGAETGWDALSSLENAYVPLTSPMAPSFQDDWLYTGRAFATNPLLLSAGWMALTREDFNGQTFWRVYLKARHQDGSMGAPLQNLTWDMNARFNGDPRAYEQGGKAGPAPAGYWVDFTEIAQRYGWERLPSMINWRTFYPSIRFNQLVMTGALEWHQAMAGLYPPEALATATPLPTYTPTPENTLVPTRQPPTETPTPTLRPTYTAVPAIQ